MIFLPGTVVVISVDSSSTISMTSDVSEGTETVVLELKIGW